MHEDDHAYNLDRAQSGDRRNSTDFDDDSDVDVLVEFDDGRQPGLLRLAAMELELGELVGREIELRTYEDLSRFGREPSSVL